MYELVQLQLITILFTRIILLVFNFLSTQCRGALCTNVIKWQHYPLIPVVEHIIIADVFIHCSIQFLKAVVV